MRFHFMTEELPRVTRENWPATTPRNRPRDSDKRERRWPVANHAALKQHRPTGMAARFTHRTKKFARSQRKSVAAVRQVRRPVVSPAMIVGEQAGCVPLARKVGWLTAC